MVHKNSREMAKNIIALKHTAKDIYNPNQNRLSVQIFAAADLITYKSQCI